MITEDYVSFEIAKLLKEKGFDEGCSFVVNAISKGVMPVSWPTTNSDIEDEKASLIALPTIQMAMKWLREAYHLHILFEISDPSQINPKYYFIVWDTSKQNSYLVDLFDSYEEACEEAIKYCLENLVKV